MSTTLSLAADMIDVRDIIERFEHVEDALSDDAETSEGFDEDDKAEAATLKAILDELCGAGGDEQWRGDWYPITLIRDSYFTDAMEVLVKDIGDLPKDLPSYLEIDWEATADNLRADYTSIDIDGTEYWFR